jgi:hypothetical protein
MRIIKPVILIAPLAALVVGGPLFEENRGQFSSNVRFLANNGAVSVAITDSGIAFRGYGGEIRLRMDSARMNGCRPDSEKKSEANYLALNPPVASVPRYTSVICREIYPGIDWLIRDSGGSVEHDWTLAAGAQPSRISLLLEGRASATIDRSGNLVIRSGELAIAWKAPKTYQDVEGSSRQVETRYAVRGRRIGLSVGKYRRDVPLVIDPVIDFSYIVNGNEQDYGCQSGIDGQGNVYLAGLTLSSDFATTAGAAFGTPMVSSTGSDLQVFVRELSPDGSKEIYSTYLGLGINDSAHPIGMRVDTAGNVYLGQCISRAGSGRRNSHHSRRRRGALQACAGRREPGLRHQSFAGKLHRPRGAGDRRRGKRLRRRRNHDDLCGQDRPERTETAVLLLVRCE